MLQDPPAAPTVKLGCTNPTQALTTVRHISTYKILEK